jgi:monoamine oxidase
VLQSVKHDFSAAVRAAINGVSYAAAFKIAWESRRFWEQDANIYGGISWIAQGPISLENSTLANLWYPSGGLLSQKGILVAGYGTEAGAFAALRGIEAKLAASRAAVEKVHPGRSRELTKPVYVSWQKVPFNLGSWVRADGYFEGPGISAAGWPHLLCRGLLQSSNRLAGGSGARGAARGTNDCGSCAGGVSVSGYAVAADTAS